MKKIHQLSFRMQIFLSSLILVIFPTVLLSTINAISKTSTITSEYNTSTAATLTQMNQLFVRGQRFCLRFYLLQQSHLSSGLDSLYMAFKHNVNFLTKKPKKWQKDVPNW